MLVMSDQNKLIAEMREQISLQNVELRAAYRDATELREELERAWVALREIQWSNDSEWQSLRAKTALRPAEQSSAEPLVWIDPRDAGRTMIAVPGERAEVSAHKEGRFTMPLYTEQPAPVAQSDRDYSPEVRVYLQPNAEGEQL
jgi:hypothetical protein